MKRTEPKVIELDTNKLEEILRRVEANRATAEDHETIRCHRALKTGQLGALENRPS